MPDAVNESSWVLGWIIGAGVVVVVAVVVLTIIALASSIRRTAGQIVETLERIREGTEAMWAVQETSRTAEEIVEAARAARRSMEG